LVEDNPVNQEVNTELLKSLGCEVKLATTGWEAIAAFERTRYDLILMDCQMPELDGIEATKRIRQQEALAGTETRTPIVALTAHAFEEDRQRCFAAGMDDYLSKPLTMDQLTATLKRWLPPAALAAPAEPDATPPQVGPSKSDAPSAPLSAEASPSPLIALRDQAGAKVVVSVVNTYLSSTPKQLTALREALDRSDAVVVQRTAHSLKSSSAIVGGAALSAVCRELERIGKEGELDTAGGLLAEAELAFTALEMSLRTEFLESNEALR
jgi:CheY-like chemotaxis protein